MCVNYSNILRSEKAVLRLSYKDISDSTGISIASLVKYFNSNPPIGINNLKKICDVLGLKLSEVLDE